ncbi:MAG: hypothetical protein ABSF76_09880 [Opitutaceae bacterium]|jgi:hypothetical protein
MPAFLKHLLSAAALAAFLASGCSKVAVPAETATPQRHHHHPPHGGTPVRLGDEEYHVELVVDGATGNLQAYILDGEMENFVRSSAPSIVISTSVDGAVRDFVLAAVANPETGETVGDTSLFQGPAPWPKKASNIAAVLKGVTIRGTTFTDVKFDYPKGNDTDD